MSGCRVSEGSRMFVEVILECRECTCMGKMELDGIRVRSRGRGGRDIRSGRSHIYHKFMMRAWISYVYLMPCLAPRCDQLDVVCHDNRQAFKPQASPQGELWELLMTNRGASVAAESFIQPSVYLLLIFHENSAYLSFSMIYKTTFNLLKSET